MQLNHTYLIPYLNKLKRKEFPKSPKSIDELISAFEDDETKKIYGKYYIHTQNTISGKQYAFTILSDRKILKEIAEIPNREILMDATFEIVKRGPYQQLLIIHIAYKKEVITKIFEINS